MRIDEYIAAEPTEYVVAAINACRDIGATTEALEAGVLEKMREIICVLDEGHEGNEARVLEKLAERARAVLAKLGAKEGE